MTHNHIIFFLWEAGYRSLSELSLKSVRIDPCGDGEAAAEGAHLAAFKYQDLKSKKKESPVISCLQEDDKGYGNALFSITIRISLVQNPSLKTSVSQ